MDECVHTVVFYTLLISVSSLQKKKVAGSREVNVEHTLCVSFGHKREVASCRDRSQATGSKAHREIR